MSEMFTQRAFICPMCGKQRMFRPRDHEVSYEMREVETIHNKIVELHVDVCDNCQTNIIKKYFTPKKSDAKQVIRALKQQKDLDAEMSLEDML